MASDKPSLSLPILTSLTVPISTLCNQLQTACGHQKARCAYPNFLPPGLCLMPVSPRIVPPESSHSGRTRHSNAGALRQSVT